MPRNPLDAKAHTRATNRANAELRRRHPDEFAELYTVEYEAAKLEVRETGGVSFAPGPRVDGLPAVLRVCPSCLTHHEHAHYCPACGSDLEAGDDGSSGQPARRTDL